MNHYNIVSMKFIFTNLNSYVMRKFTLFFAFIFIIGMQYVQAQGRVISGTITSADDNKPIPGVQVVVEGTTVGTVTNLDGFYELAVPASAKKLVYSFVGMVSQTIEIGTQTSINVTMATDLLNLEGVTVTALGISREKKSLGYATQEIKGDEINQVKSANFISTLSGKAAGVQVKTNGNMGGSTNILIRGSASLTGNNQALIVIDNVPVNNDNNNTVAQMRGRAGYDYGNAASDINPNDIESMTVLKGAAATALYGSRAANGAIIITTKKGTMTMAKKKVLGVSISSNVTTGFIDKSTFPKYQTNYGGGYGADYYSDTTLTNGQHYPGFEYIYDINGDGVNDWTVPTREDASLGQKFDDNVLVYQYNSFYPQSEHYKQATPWKSAENGPITFFETPWSYTNSVDVTGGSEASSFRLSYTNQEQSGIMPNSHISKNNVLFNGSYDVVKNLKVSASANYINTQGKGRNSTGYSDNIMSSFRQWMETNVDWAEQKQLYEDYEENITWNPNSPDNLAPAYWDNPYWLRYQNYETDLRDRIIGYLQADWKINDYFSVMGRYSLDTYSELQEERKAVGSAAGEMGVGAAGARSDVTSGYSRFDRTFMERNIDLMLKFQKNLSEDFSLGVLLGINSRRGRVDQVFASTDGGLIVPGMYSLNNSLNPMLPPEEKLAETAVDGVYGSASLGYKSFLYLDVTARNDWSSTLPKDNWSYFYPSVSGSFIFSELMKVDWLNLGKVRLGYAQVGNDAPWGVLIDTYDQFPAYTGTTMFSVPNSKNNETLKPEISKSIEAGLEMAFFKRRLGFDFALYKTNTTNQSIPVAVSMATGYSSKYLNAGEIENKGIELMLYGVPISMEKFKWDATVNWAKNVNKVVELYEGVDVLQLIAPLQGGITINARVGQPYGVIQGRDFVYDANGNKLIGASGRYLKTAKSDIVIGDVQPDFNLGFNNRFTYKNWALSFLIDWQQGGSVFSLDQYYGLYSGLYEETDYINDLGNPVRNTIEDGGGYINDGVYAPGTVIDGVDVSGQKNTTRVVGNNDTSFGTGAFPASAYVYDATYVKLRELVITYSLPSSMLEKSFFNGVSFSLVGSNLWILYKDLPHADPESSQSSGNVQGWQSGVMPAVRNIGLTVNLQF
jgi:TonB-linked SusC/RagA family outer membrane protein